MHGPLKRLKRSSFLLLLLLPACQCFEGRWPWSELHKMTTREAIEPPTVTFVTPPSNEPTTSSEPHSFQAPIADAAPPAIAPIPQEKVEKREIPVDSPGPAAAVPAPQANTDPAPLQQIQDPLTAAVQFYRDGRPDDAIKVLGAYDAKDQDVLLCLLPLVAQFSRTGAWSERMKPEETLVIVQQLRSLIRDLQRRAPLLIDRAVFCQGRGLEGYGRPVLVPSAVFRPGDHVQVYVEVQNLSDRQIRNDQYAVYLSCVLEILGPDGQPVCDPKAVEGTPSISQSIRTDHFTLINFSIPRLAPGSYTLVVTVTDQDTLRKARTRLQFRVASAVNSQ